MGHESNSLECNESVGRGSPVEVLKAFLYLGLTAFGGPVAHLGYFRTEFVVRRRWLTEQQYAELVALCQFLPGPASSQVGMAIGLRHAGVWGGLAAWAGFTLPSACVLIWLGLGVVQGGAFLSSGLTHALKVMAVAVVAQAVWGMAKSFCSNRWCVGIALGAAGLIWGFPGVLTQYLVIALGALFGFFFLDSRFESGVVVTDYPVSRGWGALFLGLWVSLLLILPGLGTWWQAPVLSVIAGVYEAGALVFGGGHVVLPLLQAQVVSSGAVSQALFLAGYGLVQAMPGPLFTFAAFLGSVMHPPLAGWCGGILLLLTIFLPGMLLLVGVLPFWEKLRQRIGMRRAMVGINAAVVGMLGATLYDPVGLTAIQSPLDLLWGLGTFALLQFLRLSPVWVVLFSALIGLIWMV